MNRRSPSSKVGYVRIWNLLGIPPAQEKSLQIREGEEIHPTTFLGKSFWGAPSNWIIWLLMLYIYRLYPPSPPPQPIILDRSRADTIP